MKIYLPISSKETIDAIENENVRHYVAYLTHRCCMVGSVGPSSWITRKVLDAKKKYSNFIEAVENNPIWYKRKYVAKGWFEANRKVYESVGISKPRNNTLCIKDEYLHEAEAVKTWQDTLVEGGEVERKKGVGDINVLVYEYHLPDSFLRRMSSAFDWYRKCHSLLDFGAEIGEIVSKSLSYIGFPSVTFDQMLHWCDGVFQRAEINWARYLGVTGVPLLGGCKFDMGDRCYHAVTNLKREVRGGITLDGVGTVEVDMHATFPCILTAMFARGEERNRLIEMLKGGDFYGDFARFARFPDKGEVKALFQRDVVFSWRPHSSLWASFRSLFPWTAHQISAIRDSSSVKVDRKRKVNSLGRAFTQYTREGQRRLSRLLSRMESQIFLNGALVRGYHELGFAALPIHDCLLVREDLGDDFKAIIEEEAEKRLGFVPVVKVK